MFQVDSIEGNRQRLDGGAMFGNCPRAVWKRWTEVDEVHRIPLACRAMLVRDGERNVLLEAGIGAFFEPKLRERFGVVDAEHVLLKSLAAAGVTEEQIDVVVLSHLHFDHAGGLLSAWQDGEPPRLLFPRATYVASKRGWERANHPHARDRVSFIPELHALLEQSGRLELVATASCAALPDDTYSFTYSDGHTPGLMLTRVVTPHGPITFVGDLMPGAAWMHLPITMGYDRYPELLIDEKKRSLDAVMADDGWVFFTHDPAVAACRVTRDDKGRFAPGDALATLAWRDE